MPRASSKKGAENAAPQQPAKAAATTKSAPKDPAPPPNEPPPLPHAALGEAGLSRSSDGGYLLADSFCFKQSINRAMKSDASRDEFLGALAEAWSEDSQELRAAAATRAASSAASNGAGGASIFHDGGVKDSLVRLLLQCDSLQTDFARQLLQSLGQHQDELAEGSGASATAHSHHQGMPLAKMILSQFRWLEHVVDGAGARSTQAPTAARRAHKPCTNGFNA